MENYDDSYENGDNNGNGDKNTASGSGPNDPILNPITTPRSRGVGQGDDGDGAVAATYYVSMCWTIYIPNKDPIKDVL